MTIDGPREIGGFKQLFLDSSLAAELEGVSLRTNTPDMPAEPVIKPDLPWEARQGARIGHCSSVIRANGTYRLWYDYTFGRHVKGDTGEKHRSMAYAESEDGLHFTKPMLDIVEMKGYGKSNILIAESRGGDVWIDPKAPPESRYRHQCKYAFIVPGAKLEFYASSDGIHWRRSHVVDVGECDTANIAFWDESCERYVLYTRKWVRGGAEDNRRFRQVRRFESDDLVSWEKEEVVWSADEVDLSRFTTYTGQPCVDYYGATVFRYPQAGDFYVMLTPAFWHWQRRIEAERWGHSGDPNDRNPESERLGPASMDVRLGFSRDGKLFFRSPDRVPFMRQGLEGRFDSRTVWPLPNPVVMGDELWIYYAGGNRDHDGYIDPAGPGEKSGIGRAVLRLDGFVSADASYEGGVLETPLLRFEGSRLHLNVDTSGGGCLEVEILDEAGRPVAGRSRAEAKTIWGNSVSMPVAWVQGGATNYDVGGIAGTPVRLRFYMKDTKLYSFQFSPCR